MRTDTWRLALAALVLAAALPGCSRHGPGVGAKLPEGPSFGGSTQPQRQIASGVVLGENKSFAKVTYRPEVKTIAESAFVAALVAVSPDGHVLVFHDAPADIRALKAGDVLLIKNQLARKVLDAGAAGEETFVMTDRAKLGDVVAQGEINVDAPVIFSKGKIARAQPARPAPDVLGLLIGSAYAQEGKNPGEPGQSPSSPPNPEQTAQQEEAKQTAEDIEKGFKNAYKSESEWELTKFQVATTDSLLTFAVVLAKNVGGCIGMVAASGQISNFRFWSNINLSQGLISTLTIGLNQLGGKLHFDWQVAKGTPGPWDTADPVKLPGALTIPLGELLEGLPLDLEISSAILIHPALTGGDQIQTGGFTINVNQGSNLQGSVSSGGAVDQGSSIEQTFQITNDTGLSAVAPNAMVIAYAAPRFELQLNPFGTGELATELQEKSHDFAKYAEEAAKVVENFSPAAAQVYKGVSLLFKAINNVVKSNADVYAQLVSTEGVVHAPAISMVPCSKKWIGFQVDIGTAANIAGMTPNASRSTVVYQKKYSKADPPSNFCEKVGS
jgi:hypothetical protein